MAKSKIQYWYQANVYRGRLRIYLVFAGNIKEARIKLGLFAKGRVLSRINWAEIQKVTGCEIPSGQELTDFAHGYLRFERKAYDWFLWEGMNLGG